ncbi:COP9 signalosome complex subunit 7-like [Prunus avium]|uniref:COP9 signalosome complex subunit 7-like n=1 Tax=Prunus avium TaxID=42229 RepID=A0A6P5T3Y7_PRUAV|nr:COP9 signalosome complex subunit 7-like [Prunus avium]XP_021821766.1 COP9 signalosome complex subunit 7-like [Prunus avium]XP_021821767.1 COP9 signalosome complex subunit 7-like [Prunus avium]
MPWHIKRKSKRCSWRCLVQLEGTKTSMNLDVLCLFSQGTWSDYKSDASRLPQLVPDQVLKLKQLTVLTLAETNKVQFAAGRDPRPGQLGSMIHTLSNW